MRCTAGDIAAAMQGRMIRSGGVQTVEHLVTDSRKIADARSSVFFAIRGQYQDGHVYLRQAYDAGIRCFVISEAEASSSLPEDVNLILVADTLAAMQQLVAAHRSKYDLPVIGITGSNGKTIIKDWLAQMLSIDRKVIRSPRSYNSQVGVPLSVWPLNEADEIGIFEAGISRSGEMEKLEPMIRPGMGIFTNIGSPHSDGFSSQQEKVNEKLKLFVHSKVILYCADYHEIREALKHEMFADKKHIAWSWKDDAPVKVSIKSVRRGEAVIVMNGEQEYPVPFSDKASLENAVHCILTLRELGYSDAVTVERLQQLQRLNMRLEMKRGRNNCTIINDSYSSDTDSLKIALDTLGQLNQHGRRTLILSDILQTGREPEELYEEVAALAGAHGVSKVIGVGEAICRYQEKFPQGSAFFFTTQQLIDHLPQLNLRDEDILVKGARVFGFEKVVQQLEEKIHQTVLEVNLNAMVHNLNVFRRQMRPDTKLMVMVKAASYGTGSYEIANLLQYYHVDYLAVAYTDEGVTLRKAGIRLPIMVMSPEAYRFDLMAEYDLEPEIFSFDSLRLYLDFAAKKNKVPGIHIKADTGMHRLGFDPGDEQDIADCLEPYPQVKVLSVFSHLAAGDDPAHDVFTQSQVQHFTLFSEKLSSALGYVPLRHILNSGGIQRFPEAQFDMVRLGVGLYGIGVNEQEQKKLEQVIRLRTVVSQVKWLQPGDSVGYGRSHVSATPAKIATVPVGYADGLRRSLGNGKGRMVINGNTAPVVGRICMDMTMLDVTNLDVNAGDEVIVIGEEYTVTDMARDLGTIPYEVLTGISERVKRVYVQE